MIVYSICLGSFIYFNTKTLIGAAQLHWGGVLASMMNLSFQFLWIVLIIATAIGVVDWFWQYVEHARSNMMTRKEVLDEMKDTEGDPYIKSSRLKRGQSIASNRMLLDVPNADVVIVNPEHYAVVLMWSRKSGTAPICVAKGVDEMARVIRRIAMEKNVPIYSDPPSARALHATVDIGSEIDEQHYRVVAVAIRFADSIRSTSRI